ncbi:MAG: type IX secretion system sortase PorU, partial [Bacteroidales bacterium]|nr:type IX secretion system sortase PorU [Bacteroidales bacterium]
MNYYSDYTYYFLTIGQVDGKRIEQQEVSLSSPTHTVTNFNGYYYHEEDNKNLIKSGRQWFGEEYDLYTSETFDIQLTDLDFSSPVHFEARGAARSFTTSAFRYFVDNQEILKFNILNVTNAPNTYWAKTGDGEAEFTPASSDFQLNLEYTKPLAGSVGWLDYFRMNFRRKLNFRGKQLLFRDVESYGIGNVAEFRLDNASSGTTIWNVTDHNNVKKINAGVNGNILSFTIATDTLPELVAFNGSDYYSVEFVEKIKNQNLHGLEPVDMIIVTHPLFLDQAEQLALHHYDFDGLSSAVVLPGQIYNEFSSGSQDISAIRDFVKMMYDKSNNEFPKYLLLFGDGSYDFKNRVANNTNYVPAWQSLESMHTVSSYVTDDFYGFMDGGGDVMLDIGIGRLIVSSYQQAKSSVDKIIHYATNNDLCMGSWRNVVCLIADDEDSNLHLEDAEELAEVIDELNKNINIDKIYLDAYLQQSTPGGQRYPEANADFNRRVQRGALILNYVGHGGEAGLAHEQLLQIADINSWRNMDNMPVFVTATCEFSRFDDPGRMAAGEYVFLNSNGGGISLFTTTRATFAGSNSSLNKSFYSYALTRENGQYRRMGDVIKLAKVESGSTENGRKFILLGDPALKIVFPEYSIVATHINNAPLVAGSDTIKALSEVSLAGEIRDIYGNLMPQFEGTLYPLIYDKPLQISSLGNDPESFPRKFFIQKNVLYNGKATINQGYWTFSFIAPKDIAYQYDFGKLSFYAENGVQDATGCNFDVVVGGYNTNAIPDFAGPEINLYINDEFFVSGGLTNENPMLFALIEDESGINTAGGIGHDLLANLDGKDSFILNDYYEAERDNYQKGSVRFPFYNLSEGNHVLSLKAWDVYNNSSEVYIYFEVAGSGQLSLKEIMNYPNPFKYGTYFSFEHNQSENNLDVSISIYAINGQLVKIINDFYSAEGYRY